MDTVLAEYDIATAYKYTPFQNDIRITAITERWIDGSVPWNIGN